MEERKIFITTKDAERLRQLIRGTISPGDPERIYLKMLAEELLRAEIVDPLKIPRDVVTMNSLVKFRDMDTREIFMHSIVYPANADFENGKISVLAPIGMALLGYRVGDVVGEDPLEPERPEAVQGVLVFRDPDHGIAVHHKDTSIHRMKSHDNT